MVSSNEGETSPMRAELSNTQLVPIQGATARPRGGPQPNRKSTKCRYFGTKKGCRAGAACPYAHDVSSGAGPIGSAQVGGSSQESSFDEQAILPDVRTSGAESSILPVGELHSRGAQHTTASFMPVQRPIPRTQLENPREFQINQIRRKFRPEETSDDHGTHLKFVMVPTDPDFHLDLGGQGLECVLHVPPQYPTHEMPTLEVLNEGLDAESRLLVQQKFDDFVRSKSSGTLLGWMNSLDRQLERALTDDPLAISADSSSASHGFPMSTGSQKYREADDHSKTGASQRRQREIAQLVSRLGRDPLFKANSDGVTYTVPIKPMRVDLLPNSLRQLKTVLMIVPFEYPHQPCRIELKGINDQSARCTEAAFVAHATAHSELSIVAHINFLSSTMHKMASQPRDDIGISTAVSSLSLGDGRSVAQPSPAPQVSSSGHQTTPIGEPMEDRPHIHVIPRPPEWASPEDYDDSDSEFSDESWDEDSMSEDEEAGGVNVPDRLANQRGRRVLLSFPNLELHGVELLAVGSLSLTLKCERCKEYNDVKGIKIGDDGISVPATRTEICHKCSSYLKVGFRIELMHPTSYRAGTLYLDGCTAVELLPSTFIPTCSECSTNYSSHGVSAVRGDQKWVICRECHNRMDFKLPELKFLLVSSGENTSGPSRAPKKPKESLGIVAGQELPRRGRCSHYGRSYRWFRFSCCSRVFSCDRCHDAATDHPNEHANRMICGYCSREQNYRPEDCGICRSLLVGKKGTGFWEGGRGTRDRKLMSRKDPRKFKRRGGTVVGSSRGKS